MSGHVSPLSTYVTIFLARMVLTGVPVGPAFADLGPLNAPVALAIAIFKATLVVLYFMHVKYSSKLTKLVVATGLFFLVILIGETMMDYASKGFLPMPPSLQ